MLFVLANDVQAQVFQHMYEHDGAPRTSVHEIAQDLTGYIWFATSTGLFRYDSRGFRHYRHDNNNPKSIGSDYLRTILCDNEGNIWIGAMNGLNRFNPIKDSFTRFTSDRRDENSISGDTIYSIKQDSNNRIWIGTSGGLNSIEARSGKISFKRYPRLIPGVETVSIHDVEVDKQNALWMATDHGLIRFSNGRTTVFRANTDSRLKSTNNFEKISGDHNGNFWLSAKDGGLVKFDTLSRKFSIVENFTDKHGLLSVAYDLLIDDRDQLWVASWNGLASIDTRSQQIKWYVNNPTNPSSIAQDFILSVFKDRQGGFWIGTYDFFADYLDIRSVNFSIWPFNNTGQSETNFNGSWAGITPTQKIWRIASDKTKFQIFDKLEQKISTYDLDPDFAPVGNRFYVDENNQIWYGGNGSLYSYHPPTRKRNQYKFAETNDSHLSKGRILKIIRDNSGLFLFCGPFGTLRFDPQTKRFSKTGVSAFTSSLFIDSNRNLWCGGKNEVWLVKNGNAHVEKILVGSQTLAPYSIWRIAEDKRGRIWLAYDLGLHLFDPKVGKFLKYPDNDLPILEGLIDMQTDKLGYLWLSRDFELVRYHPDKKIIQIYSDRDGLPRNGVLPPNRAFSDGSGRFYYETSKELFSFKPGEISIDTLPSTIAVTGLKLFNKQVFVGDQTGILTGEISQQKELIFRSDQNIFSIEFALLSYARSKVNEYMYRLTGFEKNWNSVSVPTASYTNLPDGKYTFEVRAANGDGVWMPKSLTVKITILPPWWRTWYAYLFYLILISGVVYGITRFFWIRSNFRRETALSQVKLNFFTNVSHEIRTHLSLISGPLEKAHEQMQAGTSIETNLNYARTNSNRLMLLVNELLDFRKIQSGEVRLRVQEHDIVRTVKTVVAAFEHLAKEKGIETSFISADSTVMLWYDIAQMQKVLYNLLSNAYKFTPNGGQVAITVEQMPNQVSITVKDSGQGISAEHLAKLFTYYYQADSDKPGYGIGLALSKSIVEQHRGNLRATSKQATTTAPGETGLTVQLLRGNSHFSPDQIIAKDRDYIGNMLIETNTLSYNSDSEVPKMNNTILIIEDNDQLRLFIRQLFEGSYQILEAGNGRTGLALAQQNIPDVIVCDVMMPEMNGIAVCTQVKTMAVTAHIPVVLLTARTESEHVIEGLKTGADEYISKPFDPRILALKISNLLEKRDQMRVYYREKIIAGRPDSASIAQDVNQAFLARIRDQVVKNISNAGFGVEELAYEMGMSVSALYRKMRSITEMTVNEFVKVIRLSEGKILLESGVYTVGEVATMVGFEDAKYFSREFKKVYAKNPNEVKRRAAG
ncbi:Two component regulator propeller [Dyadobacter sp. SG02]|nr:Two component regulator propeller [Dyadobacter sp. SG02]